MFVPVPHATTEPVTLSGYSVPAATAVYANVWAVMRGDEHWGDADIFRYYFILYSIHQYVLLHPFVHITLILREVNNYCSWAGEVERMYQFPSS